ncbi:hypothetical protein [Enterococcus sp. AZ128]|uniref:hypothetical protein n=1 Tax=unclassified Enterococcus TaxID=2608891 RepID=UPI003F68229A
MKKELKEYEMKRKVMVGCLFASVILLGACQKANTDSATTDKSMKQSISKAESSSSIKKTDTNNRIEDTQNKLTNEELAVAIYITPDNETRSIDAVINDYTNAYEKDTGYGTKLQLSKNLLPDIIVSFSSIGTTKRFHFEGDKVTVTGRSNSGDESSQNFSVKEMTAKFGEYKDGIAKLVAKAENYSPLDEQSGSSESNSDTNVDTKNLTSEQFKEWVSAVLDKQFSMGRSSFPYDLIVENNVGYAYVRVKHSELQVDTITMFRINDEGQLEEEDKSNGYPASYKVVSTKFIDTSEVTVVDN